MADAEKREAIEKRAKSLGVTAVELNVPVARQANILQAELADLDAGIFRLKKQLQLKMLVKDDEKVLEQLCDLIEKNLTVREALVKEIGDLSKAKK